MPRLKIAGNTKKKKKCNASRSFPCGYSCQAIGRKCRNPLKGQGKTSQEWLKLRAERLGKVEGYLEKRKGRSVVESITPQSIQEATLSRAKSDYDNLKKKYLADQGTYKNGKLVGVTLNTDDWRGLFPEYKGTNAADVHEASSTLNKKLWAESLEKMKGQGNNTVIVLAGGGGSGKGTATRDHYDLEQYPIRLDQVSGGYEKLQGQLRQAQRAGFNVEYTFIDRDPKDAWSGVVGRAVNGRKSGGLARTVPLEVAVDANLEARQVAIRILKENSDIPVSIIDNNRGMGEARLITDRKEAIDYLSRQIPSRKTLLEELRNETIGLYERGEIPLDIAEGLVGKAAIQDRRIQLRQPKGTPSPGQSTDPATNKNPARTRSKNTSSKTTPSKLKS